MLMNSKHLFAAVGLSVLTVGFAALPGSSARKASAGGQDLHQQDESQDPGRAVTQLRRALKNLEVAQNVTVDDDGDVQVLVDSRDGWLGARISEVNAGQVKELKLPAERGVVLGKIVPDSPAAKAGLKENDVVTEINGQLVEGTEQFRRMVHEIPAGRTAQFTVWRDGHAQTVSVTLGKSAPHFNTSVVAPGTFALHMPDMPQ